MGNDLMRVIDVSTQQPSDELRQLRNENRQLRTDVAEAKAALATARRESVQLTSAIQALQKQLSPLHRALQALFGEIDAVVATESASTVPGQQAGTADPRVAAVWAQWKTRLGEGCAKVIDALLLHGDLNTQQLSVVTGYHRTSIPAFIHKMNKAGLLNKNGGRFSLKAL